MPITMSHPAIAVPLKRFGLILSALVFGSMMPDFEFFLRLTDGRLIAHTIPGLFLFCIPVGLVFLFLFHRLIKFPLLSLLPAGHQARLYPLAKEFRFFPFSRFLKIVLSLFVGAVTHIFWDSFSHEGSWIVERLSWMSLPLFVLPHGIVRVYHALQYAGSLTGLILLVYWYIKWYKRTIPVKNIELFRFGSLKRTGIAFSIMIFAIFAGIGYGFLSVPDFNSFAMTKIFIAHSVIATVSGIMFAIVAFGILWHYLIPHHKRIRILENESNIVFRTPEPAVELDELL